MNRIESLAVTGVPVPWFLDVDGVLNVIGPKPGGEDTWSDYERGPVPNSEGYIFPFVWAPELVQCLNFLVERKLVVIRWLTTWEYDAPTHVSPALGLRVGSWVAATDQAPYLLDWWKFAAIKDFMADEGGFFIWSDDDIFRDLPTRQFVDFLDPQAGLVLQPNGRRGLCPSHLEQVVDVLERLRT